MPGSSFWGDKLVEAVKNGSVPESRVTDMAVRYVYRSFPAFGWTAVLTLCRIIAAWYQMGQDSGIPEPGVGMPLDLTKSHPIVDGRNATSKQVLLDGAIEGHVLLKNTNHALPLKKPRFLSLFGYSAKVPDQNDFTNVPNAPWVFGTEAANGTDTALGFGGADVVNPLSIAPNGTLFSAGGSGANSQTVVSSPYDAITQQAWEDDTQMFWDFTTNDPSINAASDACLVFANVWASESFDRPALQDAYTDALVTNVANKCNNTIVIVHNAGARVVDPWIDHPNVTALIFAHLPGQYSGRALVSLLYGKSNPSGKLPYTVAKSASDYGGAADPAQPAGKYANFPQANFSEGVFIDYRHFDANNITPRFEFGYGLSYTTFGYANLSIVKNANSNPRFFAEYPAGAVRQGGQADLWDELVTVTADVSNTGSMGGAEVAQLYVTLPGVGDDSAIPIRQLRGFDKTYVQVKKKASVSFALTRRDLSIWDTVAQKWLLQAGTYTVGVGASSRDLPLLGSFSIP